MYKAIVVEPHEVSSGHIREVAQVGARREFNPTVMQGEHGELLCAEPDLDSDREGY